MQVNASFCNVSIDGDVPASASTSAFPDNLSASNHNTAPKTRGRIIGARILASINDGDPPYESYGHFTTNVGRALAPGPIAISTATNARILKAKLPTLRVFMARHPGWATVEDSTDRWDCRNVRMTIMERDTLRPLPGHEPPSFDDASQRIGVIAQHDVASTCGRRR